SSGSDASSASAAARPDHTSSALRHCIQFIGQLAGLAQRKLIGPYHLKPILEDLAQVQPLRLGGGIKRLHLPRACQTVRTPPLLDLITRFSRVGIGAVGSAKSLGHGSTQHAKKLANALPEFARVRQPGYCPLPVPG